jgi:hypothetical protein
MKTKPLKVREIRDFCWYHSGEKAIINEEAGESNDLSNGCWQPPSEKIPTQVQIFQVFHHTKGAWNSPCDGIVTDIQRVDVQLQQSQLTWQGSDETCECTDKKGSQVRRRKQPLDNVVRTLVYYRLKIGSRHQLAPQISTRLCGNIYHTKGTQGTQKANTSNNSKHSQKTYFASQSTRLPMQIVSLCPQGSLFAYQPLLASSKPFLTVKIHLRADFV